jgi:signal transduction histidine kinase
VRGVDAPIWNGHLVDHPDALRGDNSRSQLEDFLSIVAHEVRSPLAVVDIGVRMLATLEAKPDADPKTRVEMMEMIQRNVSLAMLLMDRMALAHDVEDDTITLDTQPVDLVELVRESVADLGYTVLARRDVTLDLGGELWCDADSTATREIVFNLLANAAKYSGRDAPIAVTLDRDQDTARLVIRDHGAGVPNGDVERIFAKFVQGDGTSAGVGLGLFISRGLARAHGGDITVAKAAGEGSEFTLTLPRVGHAANDRDRA